MRLAAFVLASLLAVAGCAPPEGPEVGKMAPDFTVKSVESGPARDVKLSDLKGKVVLLDFWATWCGPCRMISPVISQMYEKYKSQGFEVVAITDEQEKEVKTFQKLEKISYPLYRDFAGMANGAYRINALPTQVLVGRDGTVVWRLDGADPAALQTAIEEAIR